jgi:hypothetical protein
MPTAGEGLETWSQIVLSQRLTWPNRAGSPATKCGGALSWGIRCCQQMWCFGSGLFLVPFALHYIKGRLTPFIRVMPSLIPSYRFRQTIAATQRRNASGSVWPRRDYLPAIHFAVSNCPRGTWVSCLRPCHEHFFCVTRLGGYIPPMLRCWLARDRTNECRFRDHARPTGPRAGRG